MDTFEVKAVGHVRGGRNVPEDDNWGESRACIQLSTGQFDASSLQGLGEFSHAEIIFVFNQVKPNEITYDARRPRGRKDWPMVGIFAQRGKNRPNRLGVSVCRIIKVEGTTLEVEGLDAIDGTPVLDIKPVIIEFQPRGVIKQPAWVRELMLHYWK